MIPLLNFAEPAWLIVGGALTSMQKLAVVLYAAFNLWKGTLLESISPYVTPSKSYMGWLRYFTMLHQHVPCCMSKPLEGCDSFWNISSTPSCIRSLFLRDESEVFATVAENWHYILIVRAFQYIAPYVFMVSFFLFLTIGIVLLVKVSRKIFKYLSHDQTNVRARTGLLYTTALTLILLMDKLENISYVGLAFLSASLAFCVCPVQDTSQPYCQTTSCLFCFDGLKKTLFKDNEHQSLYYQKIGIMSKIMFSTMKIVTTAVFECFLFLCGILCLCLAVYVLVDAAICLWNTGKSVNEYFSRNIIQETWNQSVGTDKDLFVDHGQGDEARLQT